MKISRWYTLPLTALIISLLAACASPQPVPTAQATIIADNEPVSTATTAPQPVTASGFVCPQPNPRVEVTSGEINLFVWTEYIPQDIIDCFGLVYNIQVNREEFSSNEELYAKLQSGAQGYDIVHPSDYIINVMIKAGMLQKLDKSRIPNLANIDPDYLKLYGDRIDYIAPYQVGSQGIVYNADKVPNPPKSWADLWKPEYAGKMVFVDDVRVILGMTLLTLGYSPNTTNPDELAAAQKKLAELVPNVKVFDSDSPKTALIAGDADLGVVWNGEAFLAKQELPSIEYIFPSEGAITFEDGFGIPVTAPHPDAAYAWMNYVLQADVAWLLLQDYPYTGPNRAALDFAKANHPDLYDAYINSPITNTPADVLLAGHQIEDVGDAMPIYDRIWTEVKGGQ